MTTKSPSPAPFPIPEQLDMTVTDLGPEELLRRLEIVISKPGKPEQRTGIGNLCDSTALPVPWKTHGSNTFSKTDVFWFTQRGWDDFGDRLYRLLTLRPHMYFGPDSRVELRELPAAGQYMSYRDPYQVAVRAPWPVWLYQTNRRSVIVAARSRAEAARALGISPRTLATWGSITANADKVAAANAQPGIVLPVPDARS